jgi:RHS repeat-associated protein
MLRYARFAAITLFALVSCCASVSAQQTSTTDATTPTGQAKGTPPLGSFGGSEFDRINLFNGNASMTFPLAPAGGRAGMGAGATLSYNSKFWRILVDRPTPTQSFRLAVTDDWDGGTAVAPGWRINTGRLIARHSSWNPPVAPGGCPGPAGNQTTLTRITFVAPDGTEYEFRDTQGDSSPGNDGQPFNLGPNCGTNQAFNRKKIWITYDGTAATFVSTADIWDSSFAPEGSDPPLQTYPSGVVYLRDGTSFGITNGRVDWMQDRNGNRVSYTYYTGLPHGGFLHTITDTLGRVTELTYDVDDPDDTTGQTKLLVRVVQRRNPSTTADDRVWKIVKQRLVNVLRDGGVTPTYEELWPGTQTGDFNPFMPSALVGPSEHSWEFRYNRYGEIARVETPAHGAIEYEIAEGEGHQPNGPTPFIFRYVQKRSTYVRDTDSSPEGYTEYDDASEGYPVGVPAPTETVVDEIRFAGTAKTNRSRHYFHSHPMHAVRAPREDGYARWQEGLEFKTEEAGWVDHDWLTRSTSAPLWRQAAVVAWAASDPDDPNQPANNPRVVNTKTTISENGLDLVSKVEYDYDPATTFNNVTREITYEWGVGSPSNTKLRQVDRTYETSAAYVSVTANPVAHIRSLVKTETVGNGTTVESTTTYVYDAYGTNEPTDCQSLSTVTHNNTFDNTRDIRGNATSVTMLANGGAPESTTRTKYDTAGNVISVVSANAEAPGANAALFTTTINYFDPADPVHAFPLSTSRQVSKASGGTTTLTTSAVYDKWSGLLMSKTGYNTGETTSYTYDSADRALTITPPAGVGKTTFDYSDPSAELSVHSYTETIGTGSANATHSYVFYDGLFRVSKEQSTDPNGGGFVTVETRYDGLGRPWLMSNPYRTTASAPTHGWMRTLYDDQSRVVSVAAFDNGPLSPPTKTEAPDTGEVVTTYNVSGETRPTVTVRDQEGKERRSATDGAGRLVWVREDPAGLNYLTSYSYDARGNLLGVTQGAQTRTFTYDGLGRLKSVKMPEMVNGSGVQVATTYSYDRESNLTLKTDPRNVSIAFTYDEMNRVRTKNYSNTPSTQYDAAYFYDDSGLPAEVVSPNGVMPPAPFDRGLSKGRLVGVVTNPTLMSETDQKRTGAFYGYDVAGRVTHYDQLLETTHYQNPTVPSYNLASEITSQTYPSGSTVTSTYNAAGSLTAVSSLLGGASAGATNISYTPSGALAEQRLSTTSTLFHTIGYNSRLQPTKISLGASSGATDKLSIAYQYGKLLSADETATPISSQNNGNVARISIKTSTSATPFEQFYLYDELNRLKRAIEYFGSGGGAPPCTAAPAAPSNVTATVNGETSITVGWTDNASGSNNETLFRVERSVDGGASWPVSTTVPAGSTAYTDTTVTSGPAYLYRVRAENGCGVSAWSQLPAPVTTSGGSCTAPPPSPTLVNAAQGTGTALNVAWLDNASGANNEESVRVERSLAGGMITWVDVSGELPADTDSFVDTTTAPITAYHYRVIVTNDCGTTTSAPSPATTSGSTSGCTGAPLAPTDLTASAAGASQVNLAWTDQASGANNEQAFTVERSADGGTSWKVVTTSVAPNATSYADTTAHAQTTYLYRVRATNECGVSGYTGVYAQVTTWGGANDFAPEFSPGQYGSASSHTELTPGTSMTIEAWVRPASLAANRTIVSKRGGSNDYYELRVSPSGNTVIFEIFDGGTSATDSVTSDVVLPTGVWTHVSGGYDGTKLFVTVGGVYKQKASTSTRPVTTTAWATRIARGGNTGQWSFAGRIDQVRLSNTVRYTANFTPSATYGNDGNTKAYWALNENTGTAANDTTGGASNAANNVLTLSPGTPWGLGVTSTGASGTETIGIYDAGTAAWFLRNAHAGGSADVAFTYGSAGSGVTVLTGDWDGDGDDTAGFYDPTTGNFFLKNTNAGGSADVAFSFGPAGAGWRPIVGDWDGSGTDTIGLYDPINGSFFLRNTNGPGLADATFGFGPAGAGWLPLAGDWDGNRTDTIGLYDPSGGNFFLKNTNGPGGADVTFGFGPAGAGWLPLAGDWDGNGIHTVGVYAPNTGAFYLRDLNMWGVADYTISFGAANATPIVGDWDGAGIVSKRAEDHESVDETGAPVERVDADRSWSDDASSGQEASNKVLGTVEWDQQFGYDRWGNNLTLGGALDPATNRLTGTNVLYDSAGNLTRKPVGLSYHNYEYDAENRLVRVTSNTGTTLATYTYDAEGRRVRRETPGQTPALTRYAYGFAGVLVAEYTTSTTTPSKEYVYSASGLLATAQAGTVRYVTPDHLGTPRVISNSNGTVASRHDYLPFGAELFAAGGRTTGQGYTAADTAPLRQKFTSKERDVESGLDYFGARYFGNGQGRFTSVDPLTSSARTEAPQTWNRYAYVLNNPLRFTDPDGESERDATGSVVFYVDDTETAAQGGIVRMVLGENPATGAQFVATWTGEYGHIKADDGTEVKAIRATSEVQYSIVGKDGTVFPLSDSDARRLAPGLPEKADNRADCHGWSFTEGTLWIDNSEVPKLLAGDNYKETNNPQPNDVAVYSTSEKGIRHSTTVIAGRNGLIPPIVWGKGGIQTSPYFSGATQAWSEPGTKLTYHTKREVQPPR